MRVSLILAGAVAGAALLTGCAQEGALRPASSPETPVATEPSASGTPAAPGTPAQPATTDSGTVAGKPPAVEPPPAGAAVPARTGRPANALDWKSPAMSDEDLDRAVRTAWAADHDAAPAQVVGEQIFVGLADRGRLMVGIYQLWVPGGAAHVVVAQGEPNSEAVLVRDSVARRDLGVVDGTVSRFESYVVAALAPRTERVEYRSGAGSAWKLVDQDSRDLVFPRAADPQAGEALRITRAGRTTVSPLWQSQPDTAKPDTRPDSGVPANVLLWPGRGPVSAGPPVADVARAYAAEMKAPKAEVRRLFSGNTDAGVRFVIAQAWIPGSPARTVGYVVRPGGEPELLIQPVTPRGSRVVALLLTEQPGSTVDTLVVVPEPRTTQLSYRPSAASAWQTPEALSTLGGVVFLDRSRTPGDHALRLMTGTTSSTLVVPVAKVLCDGAECA